MAARAGLAPSEWLELIISNARRLREAGVTSVAIGDVAIALAPAPPPDPTPLGGARAEEEHFSDPLEDPKTYGRLSGVPGFTRPKKED